jgi:hypothetical protein
MSSEEQLLLKFLATKLYHNGSGVGRKIAVHKRKGGKSMLDSRETAFKFLFFILTIL